MKNFPIDWVIDQDLPGIKKYKTYTGYVIDCPFCGNTKHKFDVNLGKNVARCNACGRGFNSLQLHSALCEVDGSAAYDAQCHRDLSPSITPLWIRSAIYRKWLETLSLSSEHRVALYKRGLDDQTIGKLSYKDVPEEDSDVSDVISAVCAENKDIRAYFRKHDVRIAGFYDLKAAKPMAVARKSGILIPVIIKNPHRSDDAINGRIFEDEDLISGFQIRYDQGDKRYTYYTSLEKETGCGFAGYESIHFRLPDSTFDPESDLFERPVLKQVILTEGCLKADVASALSDDWPFIAVLGVNNQRMLEDAFKLLKRKYQTEEIILAFDQDYENNENVEKALMDARQKILDAGLSIYDCQWHDEYEKYGIKGIDDLLLFNKNRRDKKQKERAVIQQFPLIASGI